MPTHPAIIPSLTHPSLDPPASVKQPPDSTDASDSKPAVTNAESTAPLAPPPRPNQPANADAPDYFSGQHGTQYSLEPNLFEQSFGTQSTSAAETPGKSILPPVAALASPAPLTGTGSLGGGFPNWPSSLRSGPLSPAMLSGPAGQNADYFDGIRPFPTPNESSMRTGLTPGGTGSMFPPAPSPNSQAFLNSLASGGATPSTLEFHRTALNAAAQQKAEQHPYTNGASSQAPASTSRASTSTAMDAQTSQARAAAAPAAAPGFGQHDSDAANGLFLLAQAGNESQSASNQFAAANHNDPQRGATAAGQRAAGGSLSGGSNADPSADPGSDPDTGKGGPRKSKRATAGKGGPKARKAGDTPPAKAPASKRTKSNASAAMTVQTSPDMDDYSDDDGREDFGGDDGMGGSGGGSGRKMTDEEKRKNFLERNRYASSLRSPVHEIESGLVWLTHPQRRRPQVPPAQEAVAAEPAAEGGDLQQ